ncbi:MAG: HNH endonuclease [Lachnospiraceae bacterium]|nr:HNH endonuclease [Lachnospiraceae bacterium]
MTILDEFSNWMRVNTSLAESSIYKYQRAINTISNEMLECGIIYKSLIEMDCVEYDIAVLNIVNNEYFIHKNLVGNNMYSSSLKKFRYFLREYTEENIKEREIEELILNSNKLTVTEKQILIKSRIGQGKYRDGLIQKYDGKCVVTGIDRTRLLIASHIKPWVICDNEERIDIENGLLLCPNMDRLFDYGLITFDDRGKMIISNFLGEQNVSRLHISKEIIVDLKPSERLLKYMEYHRDALFIN